MTGQGCAWLHMVYDSGTADESRTPNRESCPNQSVNNGKHCWLLMQRLRMIGYLLMLLMWFAQHLQNLPSEQQIQQHIRIACSTGATRLWRNNTGTLRDQHGRPVSFGLCKGSADLIGYRTITITPEMVGQQVAVFTSIEVKTPHRPHPP
jgi:hypothetical protein